MPERVHHNLAITTNILFIVPAFLAWWHAEYIYALCATMVLIHSPIYHTLAEYNKRHKLYVQSRVGDWFFALASFVYMIWYAFDRMNIVTAFWECALLVLCFSYFAYGMSAPIRYRDTHPVFHILVATAGVVILMMGV
jgi:hypothetical protein